MLRPGNASAKNRRHGPGTEMKKGETPMPAVDADYTYRRVSKAGQYRTGTDNPKGGTGLDPDTMQIVRRRFAREEQERMLLKLARAERGLSILDQTARGEYLVKTDNTALRRNEMGMRNLENGNLARAFRNFKEAARRDPGFALPYNNIGLLCLEIGEHERAEWHLSKAIRLDGNLDAAYSNRGLLWVELGEYEKAYQDFERAIELDPDDPLHHNSEGVLFLELGEPRMALERFHRAIALDPDNPMHLGNAGMAYQEMGDTEQADRHFERAIELSGRQLRASMEETEN